jgi:pimeloyl-ACP methyl ester carboxylesterase
MGEATMILAAGHRLECRFFGPAPALAPTLVFLHEGLGCAAMWRDFPARLAAATGCGALVYSRWGYGASDPVGLPRPLRYMHDEGLVTLPELLENAGVRDAILVGHSDGASIAIVYAGGTGAQGLRALVLEAPHVFCEEVSVRSIAAAARAYSDAAGDEGMGLRARLERHHGANTDGAFWGWNRAWLDPGFRAWNLEEYLPRLRVPSLIVQGEDDPYGTLRQVDAIEAQSGAPVERLILAACGHNPHREHPDETLVAMTRFIRAQL